MNILKVWIDKFLNRLGYYKSDMPEGSEVKEIEILEMFRTYGENEVCLRFLRDMCARDIRMYFQASTDEDRRTIRGAHARTNYFISLIRKANGKRNSKD